MHEPFFLILIHNFGEKIEATVLTFQLTFISSVGKFVINVKTGFKFLLAIVYLTKHITHLQKMLHMLNSKGHHLDISLHNSIALIINGWKIWTICTI